MSEVYLSIVVPCYNEEGNILSLAEAFKPLAMRYRNQGFELILVDNGSKDGTRGKIISAIEMYNFIKLVVVENNQGYGFGILSGLAICCGEYLGWLHADLQVMPAEILRGMDLLEKQSDMSRCFVKGRRKDRSLTDRLFTFGMSCFETLYMKQRLYDINAQPTLFHCQFYKLWRNPPYDFSLDLYAFYLARIHKMRVLRFSISQNERRFGNSSWNTGIKSRIKLIKRVLLYSKILKLQFKDREE